MSQAQPSKPAVSDLQQFKEFELKGWEHSSTEYDRSFSPLTSKAANALLEMLPTKPGSSFLDIACGPGYLTDRARALGCDAIGIDFSPEMKKRAEANFPGIKIDLGDAEALPYSNGRFAFAAMNFGILHFAAPYRALSEAYRVLNNGGSFGFTVWAAPTEALGFKIMLDAIERFGAKGINLPSGPPFFRYGEPSIVQDELSNIGFSSIETRKLKFDWVLQSGEALFEAFLNGTARTGGLLRAQPNDNLMAIRSDVVEKAESGFRSEGQINIPMSIMAYVAAKK